MCYCQMKLHPETWVIHFDLTVSLAESHGLPVCHQNQVQVGAWQPESLGTQGDSMADIQKPEGGAEYSHHMVHLVLRIPFGPSGGQNLAAGHQKQCWG